MLVPYLMAKLLHNNSAPEYLEYPTYTFSISYVSLRLNQFLSPSLVIGANIEKPLYSIITPKYLSEFFLFNPWCEYICLSISLLGQSANSPSPRK